MLAIDRVATTEHVGRLTDEHETNEHRSRPTILESTARSNEQTSTNGTTTGGYQSVYMRIPRNSASNSHSNHLHMSALQTLVELVFAMRKAFAIGGVRRGIVVLLLTQCGASLCFVHRSSSVATIVSSTFFDVEGPRTFVE
jgi:hypothetical protein